MQAVPGEEGLFTNPIEEVKNAKVGVHDLRLRL